MSRSYEIRGTDGMHENMLTEYKRALDSGSVDFFLNLNSYEEREFTRQYNDAPDGPSKRDVVERWQRKFELEKRQAAPPVSKREMRERMLKSKEF